MQIKQLLILLISFAPLWLTGQSDFDKTWAEAMEKTTDSSKIDFLIDKTWDFSRMDPNLSLRLLTEMDIQFYKRGLNYKVDVWYYYMGVILKNLGRFAESDEYFGQYYTYHKKKGNKRHLAAVQMARANLYADQGLWSQSMEAVTESLNLYETLNDSLGIIRTTSKLGAILIELKRTEDALSYHRRSLQIAKAINDTAELSIAHSNIAVDYEHLELYDSSIAHYQEAFELDEKSGDEYALIWDRNNLGNIYFKLEKYDTALPYALKAWEEAKKVGNPKLVSYSQSLLANIYFKLKQTKTALSLFEEILNDDMANSARDMVDVHGSLYEGYKALGDIPNAFKHLEIYHELTDSLLNKDITQQINDLEIKYQTAKKEKELDQANSDRQIAELELNNARFRNMLLASLVFLSVGFIFYFFKLSRKIRKQHQLISQALTEKETLLKEIHHRVKNNLQVISSLLSLQSKSEEDPNVVSALKLGQDRVRSMALIHQNLYEEDNLTGIEIKVYFEKLIQSLFHSYNISPERIHLQMNIEDLHLDVETVIPLGLIVNELITNALKYAFPMDKDGTISVNLQESQDGLHLQVLDDGIGFDAKTIKKTSKSFGFRLINVFKQQLKADLKIKSDHGTVVDMQIKEYKRSGIAI